MDGPRLILNIFFLAVSLASRPRALLFAFVDVRERCFPFFSAFTSSICLFGRKCCNRAGLHRRKMTTIYDAMYVQCASKARNASASKRILPLQLQEGVWIGSVSLYNRVKIRVCEWRCVRVFCVLRGLRACVSCILFGSAHETLRALDEFHAG